MAGPAPLAVWLDNLHVADLTEPRSRGFRLTYTEEALAFYGAGGIALSARLPVRAEPYSTGDCRPFLDGLLPEDAARTVIEHKFDIPRGDTFRLLTAIGRDCAGAVVFLPPGETPQRDLSRATPLDAIEVADEVARLPEDPLGVHGEVRLSLAGAMDKLLLIRTPDGGWASPTDGAPSTHILKPEPPAYPGLVALEAYGLGLAARAGLTAVRPEVASLPDRAGQQRAHLVVERYDRVVADDGTVVRVHQEDTCQALGLTQKYQADGGPSFADVAALVRRISSSPVDDLRRWIAAMTFTVLLGNADAHGRNTSLLYRRGDRRLAPLYDQVPTGSTTPRAGDPVLTRDIAMTVNGRTRADDIGLDDLVAEATSWRAPARVARGAVESVLAAVLENATTAADGIPDPTGVLDTAIRDVHRRAKALASGRR